MPNIGDIARAKDIGLGTQYGWHKCIWHACIECGKERWVMLKKEQPQSQRCNTCKPKHLLRTRTLNYGKDHYRWKGGRVVMTNGYIELWLDKSSLFFPMAGKDGYVYEHRLVMAQHLGRCLEHGEEVHHRNKDKHDNRLENLELLSKRDHAFRHQDVNYLMQEIANLEAENQRLRDLLYEQETTTP
jgi:DNA-directed RNA polymerase subunit RPC12/RpoP